MKMILQHMLKNMGTTRLIVTILAAGIILSTFYEHMRFSGISEWTEGTRLLMMAWIIGFMIGYVLQRASRPLDGTLIMLELAAMLIPLMMGLALKYNGLFLENVGKIVCVILCIGLYTGNGMLSHHKDAKNNNCD